MKQSITIEIGKVLQEFTKEVEEGLDKSKEKIAKDAAKTLKSTSPKDTGKYGKGWKAKKDGTGWVVHNTTKPYLTHLLEKGHAKVGGGRVSPRVHILPVEQDAIKQFESLIEKVIKG